MTASAINITDGRKKKRPGIDEQRLIIMRSAVTLFAENGVRAVSIAHICSYAQISRPTFYRCFEDKDALVASIYEESVNEHVGKFLSKSAIGDDSTLKDNLASLLESIFQNSQLAQLVFIESSDPDSPAARIIDHAFEHAADVMTKNWSGKSSRSPSRVYLKSIMAAVQWIVHDAIRKGMTPAAKKEAKDAAYVLVASTFS